MTRYGPAAHDTMGNHIREPLVSVRVVLCYLSSLNM